MQNLKTSLGSMTTNLALATQYIKVGFGSAYKGFYGTSPGASRMIEEGIEIIDALKNPTEKLPWIDAFLNMNKIQSFGKWSQGKNFGTELPPLPAFQPSGPMLGPEVPPEGKQGQYTPFTPTGFGQGFGYQIGEMQNKLDDLYGSMAQKGKAFADITARAMADSFENFFFDVLDGRIKKLSEIFNNFFKSIAQSIARILSNQMAANIMGGVAGLFTSGAAGMMGSTPLTPNTGADGSIRVPFAPTAGRGKATTVEVINQSGQPVTGTTAYVREDSGRTIIGVVLNAVTNNPMGSRDILRGALA
jgi:hypothetical protein